MTRASAAAMAMQLQAGVKLELPAAWTRQAKVLQLLRVPKAQQTSAARRWLVALRVMMVLLLGMMRHQAVEVLRDVMGTQRLHPVVTCRQVAMRHRAMMPCSAMVRLQGRQIKAE